MIQRAADAFRSAVWENYHKNGRVFPWRQASSPYEILVSEIMLQQTQTDRVVPKYTQWLARFPNAFSLAEAPLPEALALWSGLGYNRRARFLQEACRIVCAEYGGVFPHDPNKLDDLPGIGPYTARAVAAFAFGRPEVFIETNIRTVYLFFFFPSCTAVTDKEILPLIEETLDRTDPRGWYYALMDYGAELKKKVKNPNRRSAHYTKQSRFEGSFRQARGAVLRYLTDMYRSSADGQTSACAAVIAASEKMDEQRIGQAADRLVEEGLLICENGRYRIRD